MVIEKEWGINERAGFSHMRQTVAEYLHHHFKSSFFRFFFPLLGLIAIIMLIVFFFSYRLVLTNSANQTAGCGDEYAGENQ